jgi:hypothetical protein
MGRRTGSLAGSRDSQSVLSQFETSIDLLAKVASEKSGYAVMHGRVLGSVERDFCFVQTETFAQ